MSFVMIMTISLYYNPLKKTTTKTSPPNALAMVGISENNGTDGSPYWQLRHLPKRF